jgi:hypothetical protein
MSVILHTGLGALSATSRRISPAPMIVIRAPLVSTAAAGRDTPGLEAGGDDEGFVGRVRQQTV